MLLHQLYIYVLSTLRLPNPLYSGSIRTQIFLMIIGRTIME